MSTTTTQPTPPAIGADLLRLPDVQKALGDKSRSTVHAAVKRGALPKPIKILGGVFWKRAEIEAVLAGNWTPAAAKGQTS